MSKKTSQKTEPKLTHSMTHYLLVIHHLRESKGYARITDISKELKVTKGSASVAANSLREKGFIELEDETKFLKLTNYGHEEVHQILSSRVLLYSFFKDLLKVNEESARMGSCLMEHLVDKEIRERFFDFMQTISMSDLDPKKQRLINNIKDFQTDLNLTEYKSLSEFVKNQKSSF